MIFNIVIVTYNSESTIVSCLKSILESTVDTKVTVVDNNSKDRTVSVIKKNTPSVILIENKSNLGFGSAMNLGVKEIEGRYFFLLNPDTKIIRGALANMITYMENHPDVGILGPKLIHFDGSVQKEMTPFPTLVSEVLTLLKFHRLPIFKFAVYPNYDYEKTREAEHLMGAALLVRKEVFDKIGFFDEKFFLWFEETDLEKRAKEAGFKLIYYPQAVVKHLVGHSTKQINSIKRQAIWNQSLRYYFQKHKPVAQQIIIVFFIFLSYLPATLVMLKDKLTNK